MTTPTDTILGRKLNTLYNSRAFQETEHAADFFMSKWKNLTIVRPALMTRMVGMAQAKLAANGLETPLNDLPNLFGMILGRTARPGELEGLVEGTPLSQAEEVMGLSRRFAGGLSTDELTPYQQTLRPGDPGFARSGAGGVGEHHADPIARAVATDGVEPTIASMWEGPLNEQRLALADSNPELGSLEGVRNWVQTTADNLGAITANNPVLMDAVGSGRLGGVDLLKAHPGGLVNPDLEGALQTILDGQDVEVPNIMKAARPDQIDPDYGHKVGRLTAGFYSLLGKGMDALVNHPAFNELYWRAVADNASGLSEEGQAALRARLAGDSDFVRMPDQVKQSILSTLDRSTGGALGVDDVDKLAKAQAIQGLQDMTIDMSKKQGWQDAARHVFPFAKHWQQETLQWGRLLSTHPEAFEKASMAVQGAEGSGFFHKDQNGNLVFNYPGTGLVSRIATGVDMPMTGKVGGLSSMTTDLFPGFGPMVSVAASKVIPNKPDFDEIRQLLAPHGDPTAQGLVDSILPSWAKPVKTALSDPKNDRDAANTTMQVARYLVSTGKYNMDSDADINKTLEAAGARARKLLIFQALGKAFGPSSPSLVAQAVAHGTYGGADGTTVTAKLLSDDLNQMRKDNYDQSTENFLDKYGDAALLFLQSSSRPLVAGAASTKEQENFARDNPDLVQLLPNSYAFFAPQGSQKEDLSSITRQIHMGERQSLTPEQQLRMANDTVGSMIYYQAKAKLGTRISQPQQAWLGQLKQALMEKYPGFNVPITGVGARATDSAADVQNTSSPRCAKPLTTRRRPTATPAGRSPSTWNSATGSTGSPSRVGRSRGRSPRRPTPPTCGPSSRKGPTCCRRTTRGSGCCSTGSCRGSCAPTPNPTSRRRPSRRPVPSSAQPAWRRSAWRRNAGGTAGRPATATPPPPAGRSSRQRGRQG
jgi:hypothetical protein